VEVIRARFGGWEPKLALDVLAEIYGRTDGGAKKAVSW